MGDVITLTPRPTNEPDRPLRAVLYLRVSTAEQAATDYDEDGYSLHAQRDACRRAAERLNAEVVEEYVDRGKSARSADRPELQAMLRRIRDQRDVDYVIVHKVDRLARSRADDIQIVLALRKGGATFVSATENIDETPSGTLLHAIMAAVAEFYSGNLAQEARKGMRKKAEFGGTPGNAPVGYNNRRDHIDGKDIGIVVLDEERAGHIAWAFRTYAAGFHTLSQLADELNDRGFTMPASVRYPERPVSVQQVNKILRNRYYTGYVQFDHVYYPGRHEALVDELTFETVQEQLTSRRVAKDKPQKRPHPLKGSIYCGRCGRRFGIVHAKGQAGGTYPYFYCLGRQHDKPACEQMYVKVERVEVAVLGHLNNFRLDESRRAAVREAVLDHFGGRIEESQREVSAQQGRIVKLNRQRQKAKDAYFADAMDIEDFKAEQQRISRELTSAEAIIQRNMTSLGDIETGVDQALSLLVNPVGFYLVASDPVKRMLLEAMFERIWLIDDVAVGADLTRPYAELLGVEASLDARKALAGSSATHMTYERQEAVGLSSTDPRSYLRVERPQGLLTVDRKNPRPNAMAVGSNLDQLVGLTGFEPAASSSRTTRATKLRHSPRKRSEST
jgi:site-specific DNA recombinase